MLRTLRIGKKQAVTVGVIVALVVGGSVLLVYGQQILDSFTDSSRVASTWNTTVNTGAGEVTLATKSCDDGVWFCSANNICSDTLGDGTYIIVKRTDIGSTQQWKNANTACDKPQCGINGGQTDDLVSDNTVNFSVYPARDACKAVGGRLPTLTELSCMYTNRASFGNNFVANYYWSATEADSTYAWTEGMSAGATGTNNKTTGYYVRCVRGW
jgi:hypothetical protein